jgi:type I restriction enzyme R subunit
MKFTEAKLEQAFIELLEIEGFPHCLGPTIARADSEVLIEEDLKAYLLNRYKKEQLTEIEAQSIILQLKTLSSSDLYESNKKIMRWLADGFILKREDRIQKDIHIELIDYSGLPPQTQSRDLDNIVAEQQAKYGKDCNIYKFANQLEIVGSEKRIPDGIIYINGLPIVVFEFKSAIREEATIHNAFEQLTLRYHPLNKREHAIYAINIFRQPCNSTPSIIKFVRGKKRTCFIINAITNDTKSVIFKKFWNISFVTKG